jgi:hypothetical protein
LLSAFAEIKPLDRAPLATEGRAFSSEEWHWPELSRGFGDAEGGHQPAGNPERSLLLLGKVRRPAAAAKAEPSVAPAE